MGVLVEDKRFDMFTRNRFVCLVFKKVVFLHLQEHFTVLAFVDSSCCNGGRECGNGADHILERCGRKRSCQQRRVVSHVPRHEKPDHAAASRNRGSCTNGNFVRLISVLF
jgi:hypothetical protein